MATLTLNPAAFNLLRAHGVTAFCVTIALLGVHDASGSILIPTDSGIAQLAGLAEASVDDSRSDGMGAASTSSRVERKDSPLGRFPGNRENRRPTSPQFQYALDLNGPGGSTTGATTVSLSSGVGPICSLSDSVACVEQPALTSWLRENGGVQPPMPPPSDMLRPPQC